MPIFRVRRKPGAATQGPSHDACGGEEECAGAAAALPLREDFGFKPIEDVTLDLFRLICQTYASGDAGSWDAALNHAEGKLGPLDGPSFVARITALVRALRAERNGRFSFMSAGCRHLHDDELCVLTVIKAARQGDQATLEEVACHLARGSESTRIELAARALGGLQLRHEALLQGGTSLADPDRRHSSGILH